jgi:hypothetical protein
LTSNEVHLQDDQNNSNHTSEAPLSEECDVVTNSPSIGERSQSSFNSTCALHHKICTIDDETQNVQSENVLRTEPISVDLTKSNDNIIVIDHDDEDDILSPLPFLSNCSTLNSTVQQHQSQDHHQTRQESDQSRHRRATEMTLVDDDLLCIEETESPLISNSSSLTHSSRSSESILIEAPSSISNSPSQKISKTSSNLTNEQTTRTTSKSKSKSNINKSQTGTIKNQTTLIQSSFHNEHNNEKVFISFLFFFVFSPSFSVVDFIRIVSLRTIVSQILFCE